MYELRSITQLTNKSSCNIVKKNVNKLLKAKFRNQETAVYFKNIKQ